MRKDGGTTRITLLKADGSAVEEAKKVHDDSSEFNDILANEFKHLMPGQINWRSSYRYYDAGESWLTASTLIVVNGQNYMMSYVFPVDTVVSRLGGAERGSAEKVFLFGTAARFCPLKGLLRERFRETGQVMHLMLKMFLTRLFPRSRPYLLLVTSTVKRLSCSLSIRKRGGDMSCRCPCLAIQCLWA